MEDEVEFRDLEVDGRFIIGWYYVEINYGTRIYYQLMGDHIDGFNFVGLESTSHPSDKEAFCPESTVEVVFYGDAIFEGVRHIFIGDGGYINYPDFPTLSEMFLELHKLCEKHCSQY